MICFGTSQRGCFYSPPSSFLVKWSFREVFWLRARSVCLLEAVLHSDSFASRGSGQDWNALARETNEVAQKAHRREDVRWSLESFFTGNLYL